ncbi:DUF6455 family protein [Aquibium oceanicum]|uniref:DUF6455 domain-containing protein n=1 Tax=Aquibium oceanicum TaxID=1670800 RepID=A0A1L3SRS2_9HYPH|nr:DUF6455 family protein [Aquibium oceanicum]APH72108.1 hypothetical protein BSQ44_12600 [Aquibium oceanicum]
MNGVRYIVEGIAERWRRHRDAITGLREINSLDPELASEIAAEVGLSVADLRDVIEHGSGADGLMHRMMAAYGIHEQRLEAEVPGVLRDLAILCSRCAAKGRCAHELEAGTARENAPVFCPNAGTFETFA